MSKIKSLLSANTGKIYVYLDSTDICKRFLQDAESEGFAFTDGTKPTQKHISDVIALNRDMTINYVGFVGRVAYQAARKIENQTLVKIDYRQIMRSQ